MAYSKYLSACPNHNRGLSEVKKKAAIKGMHTVIPNLKIATSLIKKENDSVFVKAK